jgi:hypothetical protein
MEPDEITVKDAAAVLGVSRPRVQQLIRAGQLPATRRESPAGVYQTVRRADLERLQAEREKRASGERPAGMPGPAPRGVKTETGEG